MEIAVYGAGVIAYNIAAALEAIYHIRPVCYFVSHGEERACGFADIKPLPFSRKNWEMLQKPQILVATPETYHAEISRCLKNEGVDNFILIDSPMRYRLMGEYFQDKKQFRLIGETEKSGAIGNCEVYMAFSRHDRDIQRRQDLPSYIYPVYAGSHGEKHDLAELKDDFEGGISARNRNYSELTVTYWAWKKRKAAYKGICHYRRWLQLSDRNIQWMYAHGVDAVLPLPYLCKPDTSEQYKRYIGEEDFSRLMEGIEAVCPDKLQSIERILQGDYLYNHNIVIAKEQVFDHYCGFLFSILFEIENRMRRSGIERQDRYLGYLGEVLTSVYFTMNRSELKIAHAPMLILT